MEYSTDYLLIAFWLVVGLIFIAPMAILEGKR